VAVNKVQFVFQINVNYSLNSSS